MFHNEADNYEVKYYAKDTDAENPKKAKNTIYLCGYNVRALKKKAEDDDDGYTDSDEEDQIKEYGENVIRCQPRWSSDRRRKWFIRCDNEEEVKTWSDTLQFCAYYANPPLNPDPVMRQAFMVAYRETRWALGVWGWFSYYKSEQDCLSQMIVDRCEYDIMEPVYAKIPSGRLYWTIRRQVVGIMDQTIGAAVAAGWKAASTAISGAAPKIKEVADASIGVVIDKQVELQNKIEESILGVLEGPLAEVSQPVLEPVLNCIMAPYAKAMRHAIKIFHKQVSEVKDKDAKAQTERFERIMRETRYYWGDFHKAWSSIRRLTRYNAKMGSGKFKLKIPLDELVSLLGGMSLWRIEYYWETMVRELLKRSTYTLQCLLEEKGDFTQAYNDTFARMVHDAKMRINEDVGEVLYQCIDEPFKRKVVPLVKDLLSPIAELIPEPLQQLINVYKMSEDIMCNVLRQCVRTAVVNASGPALASVDELPAKLSMTVVELPTPEEDPVLKAELEAVEARKKEKTEGKEGDKKEAEAK